VALHGTKITIPLKVTRHRSDFKDSILVLPTNLPPGVPFQRPLILTPPKDEAKLILDIRPNVRPGVYTLVLRGRTFNRGRPRFAQEPGIVQTAPPIRLTVLPRRLDDVAVSPLKLKLQAGSQAEVLVKVGRKFAFFAGKYKVELVAPAKTEGIKAEEVTIPAGKDRAKLTLEVDPEVKPGTNVTLIVRVTAMVNNTTLKQETRLNVTVVK
jgi:hypothetical protein